MKLHEYQAKNLLASYGIKVPNNQLIKSKEELNLLDSDYPKVAKVQVHAGGRGKSGGVKVCKEKAELEQFVDQFLNKEFKTYQTGDEGQLVSSILIEEASDIKKELYLSMLIDRKMESLVIISSAAGGMDIEAIAESEPEKIIITPIHLLISNLPFHTRRLSSQFGLDKNQMKQINHLITQLVKLYVECDLSMLEINPLIISASGDLICLDGKMDIDENALYRQKELEAQFDFTQIDKREEIAKQNNLNYIALQGNIGCMVNGAGLAMATMDLIKLYGGNPANFLDVGGGADKNRVTEAFKLIVSDSNVKAILVNIFGGIVRCDLIAEGIVAAVKEVNLSIPVIVRLEGNKSKEAKELLSQMKDLNIIASENLEDAIKKSVNIIN